MTAPRPELGWPAAEFDVDCPIDPGEAKALLWFLDEAVAQGRIATVRDGLERIATGQELIITLRSPDRPS